MIIWNDPYDANERVLASGFKISWALSFLTIWVLCWAYIGAWGFLIGWAPALIAGWLISSVWPLLVFVVGGIVGAIAMALAISYFGGAHGEWWLLWVIGAAGILTGIGAIVALWESMQKRAERGIERDEKARELRESKRLEQEDREEVRAHKAMRARKMQAEEEARLGL